MPQDSAKVRELLRRNLELERALSEALKALGRRTNEKIKLENKLHDRGRHGH